MEGTSASGDQVVFEVLIMNLESDTGKVSSQLHKLQFRNYFYFVYAALLPYL